MAGIPRELGRRENELVMRGREGENSNYNSGRGRGRRTSRRAVTGSVDRVAWEEEAFEPVREEREEGEDMMRTRGRRRRRRQKVDLVDRSGRRREWEYE
jgi:hypothetical protein